jgi:putative NADH-flavin reductase
MKVAVFGASGGIGSEAVEQLLARGHEVVAIVRRGSPAVKPDNLTVSVVPDLHDPSEIASAITDSNAILSAVGPRRLSDGPVASRVTAAILRAMNAAGVNRYVGVSAAPVAPAAVGDRIVMRYLARPVMRTIFCDHYLDLARMEGEVSQSGACWTVVRPPRLSNGPVTGSYRRTIGGNVPNGFLISRADVAHAMCAALDDPETFNRGMGVAN